MATKTVNTGTIQREILNREQEYSQFDQEIVFTDEQHEIWRDLFTGVHTPMFLDHVCTEYLRGLEQLCLSPKYIPSVRHLNRHITPNTGWQIERTAVRYTKSDTWYTKFGQRIFLITDYLRTREQMEFTPEPDMFHDIFGHLPYLTLDFYCLLYTSPSPRDLSTSRMPSSA